MNRIKIVGTAIEYLSSNAKLAVNKSDGKLLFTSEKTAPIN